MNYTSSELLAVMTCRLLAGTKTVFAGVGVPLVGAVMAKESHSPDLTIVVEGGSIGPQVIPGYLPISTNEMRIAHRAQMLAGVTDIFLLTQRGFLDLGIIGGAQIDRFGNVNTTVIGPYVKPKLRLPGSGGANDIISLCRRTVLVTTHERRRFVPRVDFVTSPGYLEGGDSRRQAGLIFGRLTEVVTDLGILDFDVETKALRLRAIHPGVSLEDVKERTGFELLIPDEVPVTQPLTQSELDQLRRIDIDRRFV